jgi:hypothetical protein
MADGPYNPLDKRNLGVSVAKAMLNRAPSHLPLEDRFSGAGIYAIYYTGSFPLYGKIAAANKNGLFRWPIYVGKATPRGGRRGGVGIADDPGPVLFNRIREHCRSLEQAQNLDVADFFCRHLVVDDIWIPLGESLLIDMFKPVWNMLLDGFGNHAPGSGRYNQQRSPWDMVHPGRDWAERCAENQTSHKDIVASVKKGVARLSRESLSDQEGTGG